MRKIDVQLPMPDAEELIAAFEDFPAKLTIALVPCQAPAGQAIVTLVVPSAAYNDAMAIIKDCKGLATGVAYSVELTAVEGCRARAVMASVQASESEAVNWEEVLQATERDAAPGVAFNMFVALGSLIATCALMAGSIPFLIGAMVIPPAISAVLAVPVALYGGRWRLAGKGLLATGTTLLVAVAVSWVTAELLLALSLAPDLDSFMSREIIKERAQVNVYSYLIALAAGIAGGFSLVMNRRSQLVGVMISAALIPSAAAAGIGLARYHPEVIRGATSLMLLNVALILLGGFLAVLWFRGFRFFQWLRFGPPTHRGRATEGEQAGRAGGA